MIAAPALGARPISWAARRPRRSVGGLQRILAGSQGLARSLAHLLVLSLILAMLPALSSASEPTGWVEDVGGWDATEADGGALGSGAVEFGVWLEPEPPQAAEQSAAERGQAALRSYTVKAGDTLWKVADGFGLGLDTLVWANEMADPDLLLVGSKLVIPAAPGVLHRVRPGDTLAELASYYRSDVQKVIDVNGIEPPYVIVVGQRLLLPDGKMPPKRLVAPDSPGPGSGPRQNDVQAPRESTTLAATIEAPRKPLPQPSGATAEQARFILSVAEAARESQRETGVPASVSIAQAILESFWGSSRLSRENNNYFGIKAKERPGTAGVAWYDVWEVIGGANVIQREPFRAYNLMTESFVDHGRFFFQNSRYGAALAARDDPRQFAREINRAGYATDPAYAPKLIGLMDRFNLYAYDE